MLCLSRKADELIVIGNTITIRILEIKGDSVTIGIDAPRDVPVDREEVRQAKIENNEYGWE